MTAGSVEEGRLVRQVHDQLIHFMRKLLRGKRGTSQRSLFVDTSGILLDAILIALRKCGPYKSQQHFRSTVSKIGLGQAIDEYRKWAREKIAQEKLAATAALSFENDLEAVSEVEEALTSLHSYAPNAHEVVCARVFGAMTWNETAQHLERTEHQCRSQWKIATMFLTRHLDSNADSQ